MPLNEHIVSVLHSELLRQVKAAKKFASNQSDDQIIARTTITYGELIRRTGRNLPTVGIGRHLSEIGNRCVANENPRLDFLVVNQATGRPGFSVDEVAWRQEVIACHHCPAFHS